MDISTSMSQCKWSNACFYKELKEKDPKSGMISVVLHPGSGQTVFSVAREGMGSTQRLICASSGHCWRQGKGLSHLVRRGKPGAGSAGSCGVMLVPSWREQFWCCGHGWVSLGSAGSTLHVNHSLFCTLLLLLLSLSLFLSPSCFQ